MKKLYTLCAFVILAAVAFVANAATASVYIDNKAGVILYTNGDNWDNVEDKLVNGQYVDIEFTAGLTWNLDSSNQLTFAKIVRNGEVIASNIQPVFDIGFDFEVADGDIIEIFVNAPTSGKAQATVYCDEIAYSLFIYDNAKSDWIDITGQLTAGKTATIEFDAATQSMWNIEGAATFYSIELDGTALLSNSALPGGEKDINGMKDGSALNIYVKNPNPQGGAATITVDYGQTGVDAILSMTVDGKDVTVTDGKFQADNGAQLLIFPDTKNYDFESVKLGDTELSYIVASGCYAANIDGDATLTIAATAKTAKSVAITVTGAEGLKAYQAASAWYLGDKEITLVDGANTIDFTPALPVIEIAAADGYEIASATYTDADGKTADMKYDSWAQYYSVDVYSSNVVSINVEAKVKVVEYISFNIELYCVDNLKSYFVRTNNPRAFIADSDDPAKLLHDGVNTFTVTTEQAASIRINLEFKGQAVTDVTIDGTPVSSVKYDDSDNSVWGDFSIADGQTLKIGNSTTGITNAVFEGVSGKVYNMQGVEVKGSNLAAGLYIINGKKTYIK